MIAQRFWAVNRVGRKEPKFIVTEVHRYGSKNAIENLRELSSREMTIRMIVNVQGNLNKYVPNMWKSRNLHGLVIVLVF